MTTTHSDIKGGVALISGAGSGMGRATAIAFAAAGARLILVDLNGAALEETKILLPTNTVVKIAVVNICDDDAIIALIRSIPQLPEFGRLDYALNCAGVLGRVRAPFAQSEIADDDFVMNINVRAQGIMLREEIKVMLAQTPRPSVEGEPPKSLGAIVNWASYISNHGSSMGWAYSASKHAVVGMTKSAAVSHAGQGIRVNAVAPGIMNTPLLSPAALANMVLKVPQARAGEPAEVAKVALFLCSDASSYINGAFLNIDGGWHAV